MVWVSSLVERALETRRNEGARALLREIRRRIWNYQRAIWMVRDLSVTFPANTTSAPVEIDFSRPEETTAWLLRQHMPGTVDPRELELAEKLRHLLPHVRMEGEIVGYMKIGFERVYVLDFKKEFDLPPGVAFIYDTYVDPRLRGKNVAPFLIDRVSGLMKEKGYTEIYCHIRVKNLASIKAYQKCSFKPVRVISWFALLGLSFFSFPPEKMWMSQSKGR
ncbi:MAG: GNAT family N-acetyltransferase [Candidatus Eisenbacteria bacterium]|nr:GNAT family N-acetyltransferase [Candidatus Eisenbacteria bacterium]